MGIKNLYNTTKKKMVLGAVSLATIVGTIGGNEGSFSPFYNNKVGDSYGINAGVYNKFNEGSTHNGINVGIFNKGNKGKLNGLEIGVGNIPEERTAREINGLQIGLFNVAKGDVVQLGIFNAIQKENGSGSYSFGINWNFE